MASPPATTAPPHTQPTNDVDDHRPSDLPERIPRAVLICRRAYSAADRATLCCPGHGIRFMTKAFWLVRQLPLEKYKKWTRRGGRGLSGAEKAELVVFTSLWSFLQGEMEQRMADERGLLWDCYWDLMEELDRCGWDFLGEETRE